MKTGRKTLRIALWVVSILLVIQVIPYGRDHTDPPVTREPKWDSSLTRDLFYRSCRDCHSNTTEWPWYSRIAPASWLVQHDVDEGRSKFNVSEWGRPEKNEGREASKMVKSGEMPLSYYLPLHPESRLTSEERARLVEGLVRTFGEATEDENEAEGKEQGGS